MNKYVNNIIPHSKWRLLFPILLVILIVSEAGFSQSKRTIDSLEARLKITKGDEYIEIVLNISSEYAYNNPSKSIQYAKQAYEATLKSGNVRQQARSLHLIGLYFYNLGEYERAMEYYLNSLRLYESLNDRQGILDELINIGHIYFDRRHFDFALEQYSKALRLAEELNDTTDISNSLNNIGMIYSELREYERAFDYYKRSLSLAERIKDSELIEIALNNIGDNYYLQRRYALAFEYFQKSKVIAESRSDLFSIAISYHNFGLIYRAQRNYKAALDMLHRALKINQSLNAKSQMMDDYKELAVTYAEMRDFTNAYRYNTLYHSLQDTIFSRESARRISEHQSQYESEKNRREIELLERDQIIQESRLRQETFFRNAFAIGFLLVIILIIVIINRYQLKKRSEYQYKLRTEELETIDRIVSIINKEVTVQQLLRTFLNECRILFPSADRAAFAIHSEKVDGFRIATAFGYETEIPVEQPLPSRIFYEDWLRRSEEIAEGTFIMRFKESEPDTSNWGFPIPKARLLVTITLQNRLEGFIFFDNSNNEAAFEQVDLGRILRLREHAITAITKAKVLEEVERAKQIAEEQARTTSRLLGIAMTESNTLLKELTHHSRMLAKELSEAPSIVQKLQNIERLAQRILSVSESLFDIAVLEMKESRFDLVSVNIFNLAHQCVSDYEQVADQKNQTLLFSFEKEKHYLTLADPKWLRKAMDKIVVNAITFSPLGSKISVSVKRPGRLRFEVHDEGPGLTENDKQRMFELFHRLSAQPTGGESTLGMDLYIAKKIVDLHGGNLWAESEVGKGSTFIIELQTTSPGG